MTAEHPFIVGEHYVDRDGTYQVLEIRGAEMTIRYEKDHREVVAPVAIKSRIYANILGEGLALHPHQSAAYFRTLGFFAKDARFDAEVIPRLQGNFERRYELTTGGRPSRYHRLQSDVDKWGMELRIYFPRRNGLELPPGIQATAGPAPNVRRINNNRYWWQLVRVGFRLGTEHDVDRIAASVPRRFSSEFRLS